MGLWSYLRKKLMGKTDGISTKDCDIFKDEEFLSLLADYSIRELAFQSAVNLVSNCVSKCEIKTYKNNAEVKSDEYYLLNVEPNRNQNASEFFHKLIYRLMNDNEALIIEYGGQLFVADSFTRDKYVLYDDVFSNVTVDTFAFSQPFYGSDVLYWQLNQTDMRKLVNGLYESYSKIISYGIKAYERSKGTRGKMNITAMAAGQPGFQEQMEKLVKRDLNNFFSAENAVLPLFEGWNYEDMSEKSATAQTSRDIRAMIDDVSDFTSKAIGIAPALLRGDVSGLEDATNYTLTFCIDPLLDMLSEEMNRKRNGKTGFLAGNYMQFDSKSIKHIDLFEVATPIDKLIGSGAYSVNDVRVAAGDKPINEPWANEHWMTKNYELAENMMNMQGGDSDG